MKRFLITLIGQGDTEFRLAHPAAGAWIEKDLSASGNELVPLKLYEGEPVDRASRRLALEGSSSPENDRALACPGQSFSSNAELMTYVHANRVVITGVFAGYIY